MRQPPNPHDERIRFCWKICRYGIQWIAEDERRRRVLAWIAEMEPKFPASPHLSRWIRIVSGEDPWAVEDLRTYEDFFALSPDRRSWWRPLIQSQPFGCIVPGKTTRERRAVLSRLP